MAKRTRSTSGNQKVTVSSLGSRLSQGLPPVAIIVGKEDLLRREAIQMLLEATPEGPPDPDSMMRIQGGKQVQDDQLRELFDELRTPSLFGTGPVVILQNASSWLKSDPDTWVQFVTQPPPDSLLILTLDSLDGRSKVAKALTRSALWITADRPFHRPPPWQPDARPWDHEMNSWVVHRFKQNSLAATPQLAQLLIERIGPQMDQLAGAIEKISTVCDSKKCSAVDEDVIVANSAEGGDGSAFDLVDSWFEANAPRGLQILSDIVNQGSLDEKNQRVRDPQRLLLQFMALSLKRARELRTIHRIVAQGGGESQILEAGISRPFLPRLRKQYRSCDLNRTGRIIETLIEMDWQLKGGLGPTPQELMERALVSV